MMIRLLLLLLAPLSASAQCSVCGEGLKVSTPDEIFAWPGEPVVSCGALENGGIDGTVTIQECTVLATLIVNTCSCIPDGTAIDFPTSPSPTTVGGTAAPSVASNSCSICGDGKTVTLPNAIFSYPNQPIVPCGTLEAVGFNGLIPLDGCPVLPQLVTSVCGCAPAGSSPFQAPTQAPGAGQPLIPPAQLFQTQNASPEASSGRLSGGVIGGIVTGVLVVVVLLTLAVIRFTASRRSRKGGGSQTAKSIETASNSTPVPNQSLFLDSSNGHTDEEGPAAMEIEML